MYSPLGKMPSYVVNGGEIPMRYFDGVQFALTFKVVGYGLSMRDLFDALCELVRSEDIVDLCKLEANTFNFSVNTKEAAEIISAVGRVTVRDRVFPVVNISKQTVEFRVHWLPNYIRDSFIEDFFSSYGKVTSVVRECTVFTANETKHTGVRRVMMETDEIGKRSLPYIIQFHGGFTALITLPGRQPLCLKCRQIGHMRKDCKANQSGQEAKQQSQRSSGERRSYAEATGGDDVSQQDTSEQGQPDESQGATRSSEEVTTPAVGRSNVPLGQTKRGLDNGGDHVDADEVEGGLMIDEDEDFDMVGPNGKKVKKK